VNCFFKISHRKISYGSKMFFMNFNIRHFIFRATGMEGKFGIKKADNEHCAVILSVENSVSGIKQSS